MELAKPTTKEELSDLQTFAKQHLDHVDSWTGLTRTLDGRTDEVADIGGEWEQEDWYHPNGIWNPSGDGTCIEITKIGTFNDLACDHKTFIMTGHNKPHKRRAICSKQSMYIQIYVIDIFKKKMQQAQRRAATQTATFKFCFKN